MLLVYCFIVIVFSLFLFISASYLLFIDGIQPYLAYRRLISLLSLSRAVNENPLLPTELFSSLSLSNYRESDIRLAIARADRLLSNLEESLFLPLCRLEHEGDLEFDVNNRSGGAGDSDNRINVTGSKKSARSRGANISSATVARGAARLYLEKYLRFERVRRSLVARRVQSVVRKFLSVDAAIPRCVRMLLTPGYLGGPRKLLSSLFDGNQAAVVKQSRSGTEQSLSGVLPGLRSREVFKEPWWCLSHIAQILALKLHHDSRAVFMGIAPLPLNAAVVAHMYAMYGSVEVAERELQDLFVSIRLYRTSLSRCRLFGLLLGDSKDIGDEKIVDSLTSSQAVGVYFQLLLAVHRECGKRRAKLFRDSRERLREEEIQAADSVVSPEMQRKHDNERKGEADRERLRERMLIIETLFPTFENSFTSKERKDVWLADRDILNTVAGQFAQSFSWLGTSKSTSQSIYGDLVDKMKGDVQDRIDVDDFLFLSLCQWAKLQNWHSQRAAHRMVLLEKSLPFNAPILPHDGTVNTGGAGAGHNAISRNKEKDRIAGTMGRALSFMSLPALKAVMDSIYRANGAIADESVLSTINDTYHSASAFVRNIVTRRSTWFLSTCKPVVSDDPLSTNEREEREKKQRSLRAWDKAASRETNAALKDCVLWDVNQGLGCLAEYSMTNSSSSATAMVFNVPSLNFGTASGSTSVSSAHSSAAPLTTTVTMSVSLSHACFPESRLASLKLCFVSYSHGLSSWLGRIADDPNVAGSNDGTESEIKHRVQALRMHVLQLSEFFNKIDVSNYPSQRLASFEAFGVFEELDELRTEKKQFEDVCLDAHGMMLMLMGAASDLSVSFQL
jgi:hypothetical protein